MRAVAGDGEAPAEAAVELLRAEVRRNEELEIGGRGGEHEFVLGIHRLGHTAYTVVAINLRRLERGNSRPDFDGRRGRIPAPSRRIDHHIGRRWVTRRSGHDRLGAGWVRVANGALAPAWQTAEDAVSAVREIAVHVEL